MFPVWCVAFQNSFDGQAKLINVTAIAEGLAGVLEEGG